MTHNNSVNVSALARAKALLLLACAFISRQCIGQRTLPSITRVQRPEFLGNRSPRLRDEAPAIPCCVLEERKLAVLSIAAHAATLLFLLCYFWVLVITAVDSSLFYAVFPYRYFVTVTLLVLIALLPGKNWRFKFGLLLIITVWFSILPRVSWHEESSFFINAGTIHKGMMARQVEATMRPFASTESPDGTELRFQPAPGSGDVCVVKLKDGKVRSVIVQHE